MEKMTIQIILMNMEITIFKHDYSLNLETCCIYSKCLWTLIYPIISPLIRFIGACMCNLVSNPE